MQVSPEVGQLDEVRQATGQRCFDLGRAIYPVAFGVLLGLFVLGFQVFTRVSAVTANPNVSVNTDGRPAVSAVANGAAGIGCAVSKNASSAA